MSPAQTARRRVVITGIGAVTPLGLDAESTLESLVAGRSGVGEITQFDARSDPSPAPRKYVSTRFCSACMFQLIRSIPESVSSLLRIERSMNPAKLSLNSYIANPPTRTIGNSASSETEIAALRMSTLPGRRAVSRVSAKMIISRTSPT